MTTDTADQVEVFRSEHGRSNALLFGIILMIVAESVGLHAFLYRRAPYASIALLVANVATIWWLVREFRSPRTVTLGRDDVAIRFGRSVSAQVPLAAVRDARVPSWREIPPTGTAGYLQLSAGDDPNVLLRLDPPAAFRLAMGMRKSAGVVGLQLDEPQRFVDALRERGRDRA